jgi:type II secretory pathway component PulJ
MTGNRLSGKKSAAWRTEDGFSLLEILMSMLVFNLMILAIGGIFTQMINGQRAAIVGKNISESMSYTLEVMAKELRSARRDNFLGTRDCDETGDGIEVADGRIYSTSTTPGELTFQNKYGDCVKYYLSGDTLMVERVSTTSATMVASTTSNQISINTFNFLVTDDDTSQPRLTLVIEAQGKNKSVGKQAVKLQTTISSRFYEHN